MEITKEYKAWISDKLESWAETFNNNHPDYMEDIIEEEANTYLYIHSLIQKLNEESCSKDDYKSILFHIWQSQLGL